jgi:hypothetical protein
MYRWSWTAPLFDYTPLFQPIQACQTSIPKALFAPSLLFCVNGHVRGNKFLIEIQIGIKEAAVLLFQFGRQISPAAQNTMWKRMNDEPGTIKADAICDLSSDSV